MSTHTVLGRQVRMPVRIRLAHAFLATYLVPAAATQRLIDYSGLRVLRVSGDKAVCTLVFVQYVDGDLGPYHEFGVSFMVAHAAAPPTGDLRALLTGRSGVFIHRLPVDGEFTLAAGRGIWGFPKELADFAVEHQGGTRRGELHQDGALIAELTACRGLPIPARRSATSTFDAYSHLDGRTRRTPWHMEPAAMRARLGGATLRLGAHPLAAELATLGLPRRAILTATIDRLAMTFDDATPVACRTEYHHGTARLRRRFFG
ncbi:acetoacetate decarboxylase family protein [Nocardia callitridis]|uniref:acetoacetate decarboxylase family protein n=1 Tax=Nocardia callitridis TaxID=648753 RepID=UPI0031E6992E